MHEPKHDPGSMVRDELPLSQQQPPQQQKLNRGDGEQRRPERFLLRFVPPVLLTGYRTR